MLIRSVTLKDIKSYREATMEFQGGTNAISGENGSGKSTILEAIGYALFDYKPYKIENMVRHGQKKGEIRVVYTGADEREYEIVRSIRTRGGTASYYLHDFSLKGNLADAKHHGKEGVLQAVRTTLLDPGLTTELGTLFKDIIGVPQGTIIAPFLETAGQRKEKFDPILGVHDYKMAYERSKEVAGIIERKKGGLERENERLAGQLEGYEEKLLDVERVTREIGEIQIIIQDRTRDREGVERKKTELEKNERRIRELRSALGELKARMQGIADREKELMVTLEQAKEALTIVRATEPDFLRYQQIEEQLKELDAQRQERDRIQKDEQAHLRREEGLKVRISTLEEEVERSNVELGKLGAVGEALHSQKELEARKQGIEQAIFQKKVQRERMKKLQQDQSKVQGTISELKDRLKSREELKEKLSEKDDLDRKVEDLKTRRVELETRIGQFGVSRENLKTGECPFFHEHCPKITGDGSILFLDEEKEHRTELRRVIGDIAAVTVRIKECLEAEEKLRNLELLTVRVRSLEDDLSRLTKEIGQIEGDISKGPNENELKKVSEELKELGDHRGEHQRLLKLRDHLPNLIKERDGKQLQLTELSTTLDKLARELDVFKGLEEKKTELDEEKGLHRKGFEEYRTHKKESEKVENLTSRLASTRQESKGLGEEIVKVEGELTGMERAFSHDELVKLTHSFNDLTRVLGEHQGVMRERKDRLARLVQEIKRMETLREKQADLQKRLAVENVSADLIGHIRDVFRRTPEFLRRRYVAAISQDANNRFRELMGDNSVDLTWSEDYGISMRKGKDTLDFKLLSGGQQMSAALAVRLALIRRFSGLKIAFFDEPTHNLDDERRDNLARAFYRITGFDQLLVISHDETFSTVIENTIGVRLNAHGESEVR